MQTGGTFNLEDVDWFNGGLFNQIVVEPLTGPELARLHQIAALDWSQVEPAIFGTLFERSLDPARRSQLGAHYTGAADIDRVVDPVVMAPLRREWAAIREQAEGQKGGKRTTRRGKPGDFQRTIQAFLQRLRSVTILDPACGSGNFLYIALRKLMDLEEEVITYAAETGLMPFAVPEVDPAQVMGLEISEYAVEITQAVIWIGYLQWRRERHYSPSRPVLKPLTTIREQDALLDLSDPDDPKEAPWPAADFLIGNPPS
jgi:hypothetical protein